MCRSKTSSSSVAIMVRSYVLTTEINVYEKFIQDVTHVTLNGKSVLLDN